MLMPEMLIGTPDTATLHAKLAEGLCRRHPLRAMLRDVALSAVQRPAADTAGGARSAIGAGHVGQAEMVAQGACLVVFAKQPAPLQFGHDPFDEIAQAAGAGLGRQIEALRCAATKPEFQIIGDLFHAASKGAVQPCAVRNQIARGFEPDSVAARKPSVPHDFEASEK